MKRLFVGGTLAALVCAAAASAEDAPFANEIKARQGIMAYRALQLSVLGRMAKGEIPYDAGLAQKAADNLAAATQIDTSMLWPQGSDHAANPASDAAASLWDPASDIAGKAKAANEAVVALQAAAAMDLDSLKEAIGAVGESCSGCHKVSRVPD